MTKQAGATVSPADDATRIFASGRRCQRVVNAVEMVGASDKFAELQFASLIERDEVRDGAKGQEQRAKA